MAGLRADGKLQGLAERDPEDLADVPDELQVDVLPEGFGISPRFFRFASGSRIVVIPDRRAARTFSLMPPTGEDVAAKRDLAGHRQIATQGRSRNAETIAAAIVIPALRPVLGDGSFGDVDVEVPVLEVARRTARAPPRGRARTTARPGPIPS